MSITHDNSGTRRTQAQRDAARLIEAGEFIAADTPAGQAVTEALAEAAHCIKDQPFVPEPPKSALHRALILEAMRGTEAVAASDGGWDRVRSSADRAAFFIAKRLLEKTAPHGARLVLVTLSVRPFFDRAMLVCQAVITYRGKKDEFPSAYLYGPERLFDALAPYHGMVAGGFTSINH